MCARQQKNYIQNKNRANNHCTAAIPRHLTTQVRDTEMPANLNSQTTAQAAHEQHKLPIYQRQTKEKNTINILVLFCFVSFILPSVSVYLDGLRENSCYFFPSHWSRLHYKHSNKQPIHENFGVVHTPLSHICLPDHDGVTIVLHAHNSAAQSMCTKTVAHSADG